MPHARQSCDAARQLNAACCLLALCAPTDCGEGNEEGGEASSDVGGRGELAAVLEPCMAPLCALIDGPVGAATELGAAAARAAAALALRWADSQPTAITSSPEMSGVESDRPSSSCGASTSAVSKEGSTAGGSSDGARGRSSLIVELQTENPRRTMKPLIVEISDQDPVAGAGATVREELEVRECGGRSALWRHRASLGPLLRALGAASMSSGAALLAAGCEAAAARVEHIAEAGGGSAATEVLAVCWMDYARALLQGGDAGELVGTATGWLSMAGAAPVAASDGVRGSADDNTRVSSDDELRARTAALMCHALACAALHLGRVRGDALASSCARCALLTAAAAAARRAHALPRRADASRRHRSEDERAQELAASVLQAAAAPEGEHAEGLASAAPALLTMLDEEVDGVSQAAARLVAKAVTDAWLACGDKGPFGALIERLGSSDGGSGDGVAVATRRNALEALGAAAVRAAGVLRARGATSADAGNGDGVDPPDGQGSLAESAYSERARAILARCWHAALEHLADDSLAARWEVSEVFRANPRRGPGAGRDSLDDEALQVDARALADAVGFVAPLTSALGSVNERERAAASKALRGAAARSGLQAATLRALVCAAARLSTEGADAVATQDVRLAWAWPERLLPEGLPADQRTRAAERATAMVGELLLELSSPGEAKGSCAVSRASDDIEDLAGFALFVLQRMLEAPAEAHRVRMLAALGPWLTRGTPQLHAYLLVARNELCRVKLVLDGAVGGATTEGASLLQLLAPLLALRVLPLAAFDADGSVSTIVRPGELDSAKSPEEGTNAMYGDDGEENGIAHTLLFVQGCAAAPQEVRKVAAELAGRLEPEFVLPRVQEALDVVLRSMDSGENATAVACGACLPWLFTACACLTARAGEPRLPRRAALLRRRAFRVMRSLAVRPSSNGAPAMRRAVLGLIDLLAVCVVAQLADAHERAHSPTGVKGEDGRPRGGEGGRAPLIVEISTAKETRGGQDEDIVRSSGGDVEADDVLCALLSVMAGTSAVPRCFVDSREPELATVATEARGEVEMDAFALPVRICAGNALISCCKMLRGDAQRAAFARAALPRALALLRHGGAREVVADQRDAIHAVALQLCFTAVFHVGAAAAPYAADLGAVAAAALASPSAGQVRRRAHAPRVLLRVCARSR